MIQTTKTSLHPLIPQGAQMADVEHIEFDVRTIFDYDATFMRDRLLVTVHTDGKRGPEHYATLTGFEWGSAAQVRKHNQPDLRRRVIDGALGLNYEADLTSLSRGLADACAQIDALRRPWWRKTYDKLGSWISGVR